MDKIVYHKNNMKRVSKKPLISVVIPAYNEEKFLARTLTSLKAQKVDVPFEIIVADNNSTDDTVAIAKQFGARVVVATKKGVCAARQAGTEIARGEIIISTDADTVFPAGWLDNFYQALKDPSIVAASDNPVFANPPLWGVWYVKFFHWFYHTIYNRTGKVPYISACNVAFRRSAWTSYNTDLTQGGDELYLLKQLKPHGRVILIDNPVYTSSRRLEKGIFYNIFVTIIIYYYGDYFISKLTGKSFFGSYAAIREPQKKRKATLLFQMILAIVFAFWFYHGVIQSSAVTHAAQLIKHVPTPMHLTTYFRAKPVQ